MDPITAVLLILAAEAAIALVVFIGQQIREIIRERGRRIRVTDPEVEITKNPVRLGERTDIRFKFSVVNPEGLELKYEAVCDVTPYGAGPNAPQRNTFKQHQLRTAVPRLGMSWQGTGHYPVKAVVVVFYNDRPATSAVVEDEVEVVGSLEASSTTPPG